MIKNNKKLIIINCVLIAIAIGTYISLYNPSLLRFSNEPYVPKGGDYLTDGIFTLLIHYLSLFIFYVLNVVSVIQGLLKKNKKPVFISIAFIVLMITIRFMIVSTTSIDQSIEIQEIGYNNQI